MVQFNGPDGTEYPAAADMLAATVPSVVADLGQRIAQAAEREYCTEHQQHPTVRPRVEGSRLVFDIDACCEDLKTHVAVAIARTAR